MNDRNNASIAMGVINIILVVFCPRILKMIISGTVIFILLWLGIKLSVSDIQEGRNRKGTIALLLNGFAAVIYILAFGKSFLELFAP